MALLVGLATASPARSTEAEQGADAGSVHPVLLIGVDGFEWDVVLPLLRDGNLPHLERLMKEGVYGDLESSKPTSSPIIWTSIATGQIMEKHGILGFVNKSKTRGDDIRLFNNRDRKTKAIWNILSEQARRVHVIGWWMTYPVEEINGVMVAQTNTTPRNRNEQRSQIWKGALYAGVEGQVHPPELQGEILAKAPEVDAQLPSLVGEVFEGLPQDIPGVPGMLWKESIWSIRADEIYRRVSLELLGGNQPFELFAIYFGGTDVLGHRYWRYLRPQAYKTPPSAEELRIYGEIIPRYYVHIDTVIGELVAAAPANANVVVLSDHGMAAINHHDSFEPNLPTRSLRSGGHRDAPPGFFVAAGPDLRSGAPGKPIRQLQRSELKSVGTILDVTPTLLALFGVPIGRDMDGQVMECVLEASVLAAHPVQRVDTHTPPGWRQSKEAVKDVNAEERIRQLRALGYLENSEE
jgi:predicted AlkP superfamily phosphohydrolase/phosphomutase